METGHANNVANLNTLISRCTGYGSRYNPTNPVLTITNLQTLYAAASTALEDVNAAKPAYVHAISQRQDIFLEMEKLSTRVFNALSSSTDIKDNLVEHAKTMLRKIRGVRKDKLDPTGPATATASATAPAASPTSDTPVHISASQKSYDQLVENFTKLVSLVTSVSAYTPNETELQGTELNAFLTRLKNANAAVVNATTPYLSAVQNRNNIMYTPKTGLVDLALAVKKYLKSVKSITLAEFRQVSGLGFSKPKRKK